MVVVLAGLALIGLVQRLLNKKAESLRSGRPAGPAERAVRTTGELLGRLMTFVVLLGAFAILAAECGSPEPAPCYEDCD